MDKKEQKLRELLENLCEQVPTLLVIGNIHDNPELLKGGKDEDS